MPPPLPVAAFTPDVAREIAAIARALPYRLELGVDPDRVYWVDVAGVERIGVAYAPDQSGAYWMIAVSMPGGKRVGRGRLREIVRLVAGHDVPFEQAPLFDGAPDMTMVRARAVD